MTRLDHLDIRVPWVRVEVPCFAISPRFMCTRPYGHTRRHLAGGSRRPDGKVPVYEVWP